MPLASDLYDPDTGLDHSGDAGLHVEFYTKKDSDPPDMTYCRIIVPGNKDHIHDQPARDHDKQRFPRHWLAFQMRNNEQGAAGFGTSLEQWCIDEPGVINENQRIELFQLRFQTVEQVAMATDSQIQRMPLGAAGMREAARRYLKAKSRGDADGETSALKEQVAALTTLVEKLANPTAVAVRTAIAELPDEARVSADVPPPPPVRKTRGPNKIKRKVHVSRHVEHAAATGEPSHG